MTPSFRPRRALGRTGFAVTALGLGDLADRTLPFEAQLATLRRGLDTGINLLDTAPSYEDGLSERVVGAAVRGRRDGVFVIDKVDHWDRSIAPQVGASLERLALPSVDAFVFHGVSRIEDWQALLAPGGRWDELEACRGAGKCRFLGISSHHPEVLRLALLSGRLDLAMFPIGPYVDARYTSEILPLARERGVGSVAFKTFGAGMLLGDTSGYGRPLAERAAGSPALPRLGVSDCLSYTLTVDPDVALLGLSSNEEQDAAFAAFAAFEPLTPAALAALAERARTAIAGKGPCWWNPPGA